MKCTRAKLTERLIKNIVIGFCFERTEPPQRHIRINTVLNPFKVRGALLPYLLKVALHSFVCQQQDRPHQVSHQDEVAFGFQVQGHDVVVVVAFGSKLFLSRPLIQTDLKHTMQACK